MHEAEAETATGWGIGCMSAVDRIQSMETAERRVEATLAQLEGLAMDGRGLAARGWRWGLESSQPLFSLSRRSVVAQVLLLYNPPACVCAWSPS